MLRFLRLNISYAWLMHWQYAYWAASSTSSNQCQISHVDINENRGEYHASINFAPITVVKIDWRYYWWLISWNCEAATVLLMGYSYSSPTISVSSLFNLILSAWSGDRGVASFWPSAGYQLTSGYWCFCALLYIRGGNLISYISDINGNTSKVSYGASISELALSFSALLDRLASAWSAYHQHMLRMRNADISRRFTHIAHWRRKYLHFINYWYCLFL